MNERFKELAVQSELWRMLEEYSWEFGSCDPEKDCGRIEKFAELIIEDSIGILVDHLEGLDKEQKKPSFIGMAMTITHIREHFGVKS